MNDTVTRIPLLFAVCLTLLSCGKVSREPSLEHGDWPQYRADTGRTAYTPSELPNVLTLRWKLEQPEPRPAWRGVHTRMIFDYAYQPVVSGKTLFFGSSADNRIYAVDTSTGRERWSFFTGGPVRFAPAVHGGRVYAGSDDGYLYCLDASGGTVVWKKRLAPEDALVIGNDRMVSRWPVRGGIAIRDGVLYAGAGIWPTEGIYVYAIDPETGGTLWVNDDSGGLELDQPHGGAQAKSGISSQGYLLSDGGFVYVPTGRAVPAALDLATGGLAWFHLQKYRTHGGSRAMTVGGYLFIPGGNTNDGREIIGTTNAVFSAETGEIATRDEIESQAVAATSEHILYVDRRDGALKALNHTTAVVGRETADRRGSLSTQGYLNTPSWSIPIGGGEAVAIAVAGKDAVVGAADNRVTVADMNTGTVRWKTEVDGVPWGIAVAHGQLFVATERGSIYCFDGAGTERGRIVSHTPHNRPYGGNEVFARAADAIVRETGTVEGFCLDMGCGDGALTYELAKRTNMYIVAVDPDRGNVERARKLLAEAGLYGIRAVVFEGTSDAIGLPDYFADVVVSGRSVRDKSQAPDMQTVDRLLRPYGGMACFGPQGGMRVAIRGELPGAGDWHHQYHDPANTITSSDVLVREGLEILWYKDDCFDVPSRHGRGIGPLYSEGRMFVQGLDAIRCYNAYNGRILWEYATPAIQSVNDFDHALGTAATHQNWCIDGDRLYVRIEKGLGTSAGREVVALDTATGAPVATYTVPGNIQGIDFLEYWGYLAVSDGIIYGTVANYDHTVNWGWGTYDTNKLFTESVALFAMDAASGDVLWMYRAKDSIRHNAIAIGGGRVYLIDRPVAEMDRRMLRPSGFKPSDHANGVLVALDARTGGTVYTKRGNIYGTLLALSVERDVLVMTYQFIRFAMSSEFGGRMSGFRASDGTLLWETATGVGPENDYPFSSRPIINDGTIYLEPWAWDLETGRKLDFRFEHSYTCGIVAAARHMLVYRSATLGYLDLDNPGIGTQNYGGIRPGCWINAIPAGGLVLMPDATDRCNCSYLIKATVALKPSAARAIQ